MIGARMLLCCQPLLLAALALPTRAQDGVCAKVVIQINQSAVLARDVFQAGLGIENSTPDLLQGMGIFLEIRDEQDDVVTDLFDVSPPELSGIADLSGLGELGPAGVATALWSIWPTDAAAAGGLPEEPRTYFVGGTIQHVQNGAFFETDIAPIPIDVYPPPELHLDYYLQTTVYSDNPFSELLIEQAEPFSLGLRVRNLGAGVAKAFTVTSAQPEIVENEKGLVLSISILGAQVGLEAVAPSLKVAFGDIGPGMSAVARWLLTSTIQGEFEDLKVDFTHVSAIGEKDVSLIESVAIHPLVHTGLVDGSSVPIEQVDGLPDFLVDEPQSPAPIDPLTGEEMTDFPSSFHLSSGAVLPITGVTDVTIDAPPNSDDMAVVASALIVDTGWHYIRLDDPSDGLATLVQVSRTGSGGPRVSFPVGGPGDIVNVWTTSRPVDLNDDLVPDVTQHLLHVVDHFAAPGAYEYDLIFQPVPQPPLTSDVDVISVSQGGTQELRLDAGPDYRGSPYMILGSISGTVPGVVSSGLLLPLNPDMYFNSLLTSLRVQAVFGTTGVLDQDGQSPLPAAIRLKAASDPALVGLMVHHAAVVFSSAGQVVFVSNPIFLLLAP